MTKFEVAVAAHASLGEGPVWDDRRQELIWVDVDGGLVHTYRPGDGATAAIEVGQPVGCAVPRATGGLLLALRDGFASLVPGSARFESIAAIEPDRPDTRMNDGACDRRGRFWAGTMTVAGPDGTAALYRLDADRSVTRVFGSVTISNGLGWSPDDRYMYFIDSPLQRIDVFDFDLETGTVVGRRTLVEVPEEQGMPDGMTVDAEGGLWVALWGGGVVHRYSPEGRLDSRFELPVRRVTSCCFGDPDLTTLYVTTAARGASADEPLAGALLACRPGIAGLPAEPFAG